MQIWFFYLFYFIILGPQDYEFRFHLDTNCFSTNMKPISQITMYLTISKAWKYGFLFAIIYVTIQW